jgi:hypothetical protein
MKGWVYVLSMENTEKGVVKIGCTSKDPESRARDLSSQTAAVGDCEVRYAAYCRDYKDVEKKVHQSLNVFRIDTREWFACTLSEAISEIKKHATILHEDPVEPLDTNKRPYRLSVSIKEIRTNRKGQTVFTLHQPEKPHRHIQPFFELKQLTGQLKKIKIQEGRRLRISVKDDGKPNQTVLDVYRKELEKFQTSRPDATDPTAEEEIAEAFRLAREATKK